MSCARCRRDKPQSLHLTFGLTASSEQNKSGWPEVKWSKEDSRRSKIEGSHSIAITNLLASPVEWFECRLLSGDMHSTRLCFIHSLARHSSVLASASIAPIGHDRSLTRMIERLFHCHFAHCLSYRPIESMRSASIRAPPPRAGGSLVITQEARALLSPAHIKLSPARFDMQLWCCLCERNSIDDDRCKLRAQAEANCLFLYARLSTPAPTYSCACSSARITYAHSSVCRPVCLKMEAIGARAKTRSCSQLITLHCSLPIGGAAPTDTRCRSTGRRRRRTNTKRQFIFISSRHCCSSRARRYHANGMYEQGRRREMCAPLLSLAASSSLTSRPPSPFQFITSDGKPDPNQITRTRFNCRRTRRRSLLSIEAL